MGLRDRLAMRFRGDGAPPEDLAQYDDLLLNAIGTAEGGVADHNLLTMTMMTSGPGWSEEVGLRTMEWMTDALERGLIRHVEHADFALTEEGRQKAAAAAEVERDKYRARHARRHRDHPS